MMRRQMEEYLRGFLTEDSAYDWPGDTSNLSADIIHELDQSTAEMRSVLLDYGLDLNDPAVLCGLTFGVRAVRDIVEQAVREHADDGCHFGGNCEVSGLIAVASIEDFFATLAHVIKQKLTPDV